MLLHIISKQSFLVVLEDDDVAAADDDDDDNGSQIKPLSVDILLDLRDFQDHQAHFANPLDRTIFMPRLVVNLCIVHD